MKFSIKKIDWILCFILITIAFVSRAPLVEQFQSHWDGPQYSIALIRYSFEQQTPAPPGYPLYIGLGMLFNFFINDPHKAILAVSIFSSILGVVVFYLVGKTLYAKRAGLTAAIIFLTGSTFYYFGLTAYAYGLIAVTTTILAYIVYQISIKKKPLGLLLGLVYGLCFAIRPQESIQTGFLFLFGFIFLSTKEKIKVFILFLIITLMWFIPITKVVGGIPEYFTLSYQFAQGAIFNNAFLHHVELMIKGVLLSFGLASSFLLFYLSKLFKITSKKLKKNNRIIFFYSSWILPGIFYNLFIRTEHAGYQMSYLAGLLLLISYAIWQTTKNNKIFFTTVLIVIASFNLYWFFYDRDPDFIKPYRPTSFHYSDIRKNDVKIGSKVSFIKNKFDPQSTLLVSTEALWRPYSYYLRDYHTIALFRLDNTTIPYSYNRIDVLHWNMHWYQEKNFVIQLSKHITSVIFMDDNAFLWINDYPFQTYTLSGNNTVTEIKVKPNYQIQYNYHQIKVIKK